MIKEGIKKFKERKLLESLSIFSKLNKSNPNNADILFFLGNIYYELNDLKKSMLYFEQSLNKLPDSLIIINNYAIVLQSLGQFEKAKKLFQKVIKLNPTNIKAYYRLFSMNLENFNKKYLNKIKSLEIKSSLDDKSLINFICSKYEKTKNIKNEIRYLSLAHEYQFKSRIEHNKKLTEYHTQILNSSHNKINFLDKNKKFNYLKDIQPIFIIGLPRSGSTLIESLFVQNNDDCYSYGESSIFDFAIFNQIKKNILTKDYDYENFNISINPDILLNNLENIYSYSDKKIFVDKSLENFFYIDLILKIFPKAKFIHTFRDKFDSIIAIYQSMLIYLPWSHSIDNISKYILNYEKNINYFKKKYSDKILDIKLEDFTSDPKSYLKSIFQFCNVKPSEDLLNFNNDNDIFSKTSSFLQIRQGIQKYNYDKYKPYYFLIKNKL
ncbi:sulfotransferase [Candidatus Pelagibacter sp.]|nr:sulfotransferase [Candidatus Pelagibacter sp.]